MPKIDQIAIEEIQDGAILDLLNEGIAECIANILDPNKSATAARAVTLKITLSPNEERDQCRFGLGCSLKLAPDSPIEGRIDIGMEHGQPVIAERKSKQTELQELIDAKNNVAAIGSKKDLEQ